MKTLVFILLAALALYALFKPLATGQTGQVGVPGGEIFYETPPTQPLEMPPEPVNWPVVVLSVLFVIAIFISPYNNKKVHS